MGIFSRVLTLLQGRIESRQRGWQDCKNWMREIKGISWEIFGKKGNIIIKFIIK